MPDSIYAQSAATMGRMLKHLDNIVSKAEAYADANEIEPDALLQARLFPDMRNFIFQIQVATDIAKSCAARLSGTELPKWEDNEQTFSDVHARIKKARDFIASVKPEQFKDCADREIVLKLRDRELNLTGESFLLDFAQPNFYFHMTTAYNLLRHNGLAIGKKDFLGG